jgi:hypothetical protein
MHQNVKRAVHGALALFIFALSGYAQDNPNAAPSSAAAASRAAGVPRMIRFAGALRDQSGEPLTGSVTVKFSLYELQSGESPLWAETQDLTLDAQGRYAVLLGAASPNGLPLDIFTSGKALWLGVEPQVPGLGEQPRGLLVAVPYALKAVDADTLGGKPASAYVQTDQAAAGSANLAAEARASGIAAGQGGKSKDQLAFQAGPQSGNFLPCTTLTSDGTLLTNVLPKYSSIGCQLTASAITESGGRVGIGTANPAAALEVSGTAKFDQLASLSGGVLTPNGTATPSAGANSNPLDLQALSYRSTDGHTGTMYFRWLAEPTGNNTSTPAAKLSLQFSSWGGSPFETGLSIAPNGAITFANSQQFPNVMNATGPAPEQTLFGDNGAMQFGLNQPVNEGFFIAIVDDPAGGRVSDAFVIVPNSSTATLASSVGAGATSLSLSKPLPLGAYSGLLIGTNTAKNQEVLKVASGGGTAVQTVSPTKYAHASGSLVTTLADRGDPPTLYLNGNTLVERPYNTGSGPGNYGNALKVSSQLVHPTVFPNLDYGQLHVQQTGPAAHANLAKLTFGTSNCAGACGAIGLAAAGAGSSMYLGTSNNYSAGVTNTALTIDPSGHVGFGTTTPSATLEVNGAAKFDQAVTAAGNITAAKFIGDGSMLKNISIGISSNSSLYDSATPARKNPLGPPPTACTAQAHGAGNLTGVYQWAYAESDASGVTTLSPAVTFAASNNTV